MSDQNIQKFMELTSASANVAQDYLLESNDELDTAINSFFADRHDDKTYKREHEKEAKSGIAKPIQKQPSPISSGTNPRKKENTSKPKFKSFSELLRSNSNDGDDDPDNKRNTFAGGETSGLEVTDPNDSNFLIRDLLEKAKRGGELPSGSDDNDDNESQNSSHFTGKGYRLGSTIDVPSAVVEDFSHEPNNSAPRRVTREITFWKEGFQVGPDGPLYRYDDPANAFYLKELNQGRAPLKLLNVEFGQEVDVNVYKKLDESYKPPKRKLGGFQGQGQRLGSPVPGDSYESAAVEREDEEAATKQSHEQTNKKEEEPKKGDTSIQIRYANGKREILHCNSTDKVEFLYDYVKNSVNNDSTRIFTLNHTFPVKPIENMDYTIKEEGLCNATVVQRWVM
ncbi:related to UBX domain-containing protein 1 [Saccharomycodes ludwigii]|uniref:Related to UBX domain-containing protein 1 n=1 Tax=Saccharomycodes ludwigii TaxID=36035 RepID=A0A376B937_9ASCO|nr:hypothetical protein SCDLUD_000197 [Saccharomycodes ludwigii]KAH3902617.1 hypothetical protein SCDLUD_000197 [Saccharomycodes ludwigii]SSD61186.1 related to UBX domain-containing protein 1 [Saccharomycodes ludwigii]